VKWAGAKHVGSYKPGEVVRFNSNCDGESLKYSKQRNITTKFLFDKKMQAVGRILPVGRKE